MLAAAAVRRGGSEAFFIGSHFQRCQMKMMGMILLSRTTSSLLSINLSNYISSFSSSSRYKHKNDASSSFRNVHDALASFNDMLHRKPLPCIIQFAKLLSAIVKMGQYYDVVISLSKQMELAGISPNTYTLSIFMNCFCQLLRVDLGFSVLAKVLKLVMYRILVHAMCKSGNHKDARKLFSELIVQGFQPHVQLYTTIINGLCKEGLLEEALKAFRNMEADGCPPR
ncbi:hypothetical protein OIU76_008648 [Salix suchowensis]|nr:hypothetical protein OIU76_008648 [Salix suchowensis]